MEKKNAWIADAISLVTALLYLGIFLAGLAVILVGWFFLWWPLALLATIAGGTISLTSVVWAILGVKKFDQDKYEGGVFTVFDKIFTYAGEEKTTITFKGLAVFLPPFTGAIRVDLKNDEWVFPMEAYSVEIETDKSTGKHLKMILKGKVEITANPDPCNMYDFIKAGKMDKIKEQSSGIALREVQKEISEHEGRGMTMWEIVQNGYLLSASLESKLNGGIKKKADGTIERNPDGTPIITLGLFEQKDFGVKARKVQVKFEISKEVADALTENQTAILEVNAQRTRTQGDVTNAKDIEKVDAEAWDRMVQADQLRQGLLKRAQIQNISTGGNGKGPSTINLVNLDVDMFEGKKGGKKDK